MASDVCVTFAYSGFRCYYQQGVCVLYLQEPDELESDQLTMKYFGRYKDISYLIQKKALQNNTVQYEFAVIIKIISHCNLYEFSQKLEVFFFSKS